MLAAVSRPSASLTLDPGGNSIEPGFTRDQLWMASVKDSSTETVDSEQEHLGPRCTLALLSVWLLRVAAAPV